MATISGISITNAIKTNLVEGLALAFEQGQIQILNDPVLIGELQAFESEQLPSGLVRYSAPDGMHDDCVSALMLAWAAATSGQRRRARAKEY